MDGYGRSANAVQNCAQLAALGGAPASVGSPPGAFTATTVRRRRRLPSGSILGGLYLCRRRPFSIPNPTWMELLWRDSEESALVPDNTIAAFNGLPDEGTLLREWSDPRIWRVMNGVRRWVTTPPNWTSGEAFLRYASFRTEHWRRLRKANRCLHQM